MSGLPRGLSVAPTGPSCGTRSATRIPLERRPKRRRPWPRQPTQRASQENHRADQKECRGADLDGDLRTPGAPHRATVGIIPAATLKPVSDRSGHERERLTLQTSCYLMTRRRTIETDGVRACAESKPSSVRKMAHSPTHAAWTPSEAIRIERVFRNISEDPTAGLSERAGTRSDLRPARRRSCEALIRVSH
jgi:hypothetical protein